MEHISPSVQRKFVAVHGPATCSVPTATSKARNKSTKTVGAGVGAAVGATVGAEDGLDVGLAVAFVPFDPFVRFAMVAFRRGVGAAVG
jgi:hypothetical protein